MEQKPKRPVRPARFISEDGKEIIEASMKKTIVKGGVTYKRVPREKPKSRADRLGEYTDRVSKVHASLEEIQTKGQTIFDKMEALDEKPLTDKKALKKKQELAKKMEAIVTEATTAMEDFDKDELDELTEEITGWRDNMDSAGISHLPKYEEVSECSDALEQAQSEADTAEGVTITCFEDIQEAIDALQSVLDECENVSFPGMY